MKKTYGLALAAWLISPSLLLAAETDPVQVEGQLNLGVRSVNGGEDSAYFQEFKDESDGIFGSVLLDAYKKNYYLGTEAENFGLSDQYYSLHGGDYRNFSFKGFYNEIPHNISFGALTPFTGIGTKSLRLQVRPAPTDTGLWQQFDYDFTRKQYGGEMKINLNSPFYIKVGAKREERDGVKPLGSGFFTPGSVEMPEPVDYKTDDLTVEGGYLGRDLVASVSGYLSSFNNKNLFLAWDDPFAVDFPPDFPTLNTLPPQNDYGKVVAEATWKALPMSSVLAVRGSYSHLENDFSFSDVGLSRFTTDVLGANGFTFTTPTFDGSIIYYNGSVALTSRPTRSLDTRLYYNYLDKVNDSSVITTIEPSGDVASNSDTLFGYRKNDAGIDVGFQLPLKSKAEAGYEYRAVHRINRPIVEKTTDNIVHVQLANRSLEFMTGKVRYEHLFRDTDSGQIVPPGTTAADPDFLRLFLGRFDAIDKDEDQVELDLAFFLLPNVDLGFDYRLKRNDYKDTVIGRTKDLHHEFYGDVLWRLPRQATLSAFAGYEIIKFDSTHFSWDSDINPANPFVDGGSPPSFLWTQDTNDDYWTYGISARAPIVPQLLDVAFSWSQDRSDGQVDFTTQGPTPLIGIGDSDDYDRKRLEARLIYAFAPKTDITLGYIYEKFTHDDLKLEDYQHTTNEAYLTGAYTDLDFEANIGYLLLSYNF